MLSLLRSTQGRRKMPNSIRIKSYKVLKNMLLGSYHSMLISLAMWVATRYSSTVFTSAWREGDLGVHGTVPCRGLDIRSWIYENPQEVCNDINNHYIYDPQRPRYKCALYCDEKGNKHIHLQVHPRTTYTGG